MEQLHSQRLFTKHAGSALSPDTYSLVDVGAGGGLAPAFGAFSHALSGFAFDPDAADMERQNAAGIWGGVRFVPAFVGVPKDDPRALVEP